MPHVDGFHRHRLYATGPAPKGRKDSAQGFNPGLGVLAERALKGHQTASDEWTPQGKFMRAEQIRSGATFRAHLFATDNPGLKPRAESYRPFGALLTSLSRGAICRRHNTPILQYSNTPFAGDRGRRRGQPARRSFWSVGRKLVWLAKSGERSASLPLA
jgi:hypothetical protein